jgi:hypothetical protein
MALTDVGVFRFNFCPRHFKDQHCTIIRRVIAEYGFFAPDGTNMAPIPLNQAAPAFPVAAAQGAPNAPPAAQAPPPAPAQQQQAAQAQQPPPALSAQGPAAGGQGAEPTSDDEPADPYNGDYGDEYGEDTEDENQYSDDEVDADD